MNSLIAQLNTYFGQKAPSLPAELKELLVKFGPYLIIIGLIMAIVGLLSAFSFLLGSAGMMAGYYPGSSFLGYSWIGVILSLAVAVLQLIALPALFKRQMKGWTFLFYALLVSLIGNIVYFDLLSLVLSAVIGLYILFQVRSYYH